MIDRTRYVIKHAGTHHMLAWSYIPTRALACAQGLADAGIPCYVETIK